MDFSRLFTEAKDWKIAEKTWELPDDPVLEYTKHKIKLVLTHEGLLDDRGVKLVRLVLYKSHTYKTTPQGKTPLKFTQKMIDSLSKIEHISIHTRPLVNRSVDCNIAEIPVDYPDEIKAACKIIINEMNDIIQNSKNNGELLDKFKNDMLEWLDEFAAS